MSIRLRPPQLVTSFLGMDLKVGVNIISLFAILNKVAGVYGILAVLTGGAEWTQVIMYGYSIVSIYVFVWGIKKISSENGPDTLLYAHFFAADHAISTVFTALFAIIWYAYTPHDGRRIANSDAQKAMLGDGPGMDDVTRIASAMQVWKYERGFSGVVLVLSWLLKVYFIFCVYSFALHLRRGTYHSLPRTKTPSTAQLSSSSLSYSHTRHSSTGGARYTHLRGSSVATIDDGTSSTLAETLWEDDDAIELAEGGALKSPATARGTGMVRGLSGGGNKRGEGSVSGSSVQSTPVIQENSFTKILGRLSDERPR